MSSSVFTNQVLVSQRPQTFDPHRMPEAVKVVPPINTRTFLFHADPAKDPRGEGIIIEGVGATDAERIADFKAKLAIKEKMGWSTERQQHGTHPHSNDTHRIEMQTMAAENGDRAAKTALEAKAARTVVAESIDDLKIERDLQAERIARLEAELEAARATTGKKKTAE